MRSGGRTSALLKDTPEWIHRYQAALGMALYTLNALHIHCAKLFSLLFFTHRQCFQKHKTNSRIKLCQVL